jgi:flagellar assembly protein FliH
MIIRDAVLTEHSKPLRAPQTERAAVSERPLAASIASAALGVPAFTESAIPAPTTVRSESPPVAPLPKPIEKPLTFETVAAWLAVQDGETRTACASLLAEELTRVHESAKTEGFRAGELEGLRKAEEGMQGRIEHLRAINAAIEARLARELDETSDACADIVVAAFVKLAGTSLVTRAAARGAVEQVLARVKEARELTIRAHSADAAALSEIADKLSDACGGRKLQIVPDARVELGGCIVESQHGSLDGRFESQLRELFETLRAAKLGASEHA